MVHCRSRRTHLAPVPVRTTGTVRQRIFKSSQSDQLSMYSRSSRTQSLKSVTLLRPLICHRQVSPGLTLSRRRCARSLNRLTSSTGSGRGPTRLISPRSTLKSCGNSSRLNLRRNFADGRDARVVGHLEDRAAHLVHRGQLVLELLGVGHHGAELVDGEGPAVEARSAAAGTGPGPAR